MVRRLTDRFKPGDLVEIVFIAQGETSWRPAVVRGADPPGLWVQTQDEHLWFVTNTNRIRERVSPGATEPPSGPSEDPDAET
jgi:hypothetical protein